LWAFSTQAILSFYDLPKEEKYVPLLGSTNRGPPLGLLLIYTDFKAVFHLDEKKGRGTVLCGVSRTITKPLRLYQYIARLSSLFFINKKKNIFIPKIPQTKQLQ